MPGVLRLSLPFFDCRFLATQMGGIDAGVPWICLALGESLWLSFCGLPLEGDGAVETKR